MQTFSRRIRELANEEPKRPAVVFVGTDGSEREVTRLELDARSTKIAWRLQALGVDHGSLVAIAMPNSPEHLATALATWKIGACVLPLSPALPPLERRSILDVAQPAIVVGAWLDGQPGDVALVDLDDESDLATTALPDIVPHPGKAICSGGSTGRPKVIIDPSPWVREPGRAGGEVGARLGMRPRQTQLVSGPLYFNAPFCWSHWGLFDGHILVLMERFDPERAVELVARHRISWGFLVPTMMSRIAALESVGPDAFASVDAFWHGGAPCAAWLKRRWLKLLGHDRIFEAYGATEALGAAVISGTEWLEHPGSVGRAQNCEIRILDDDLRPLLANEIGEIFMRPTRSLFGDPQTGMPPFEYRGAPPPRSTEDGFASVGDFGWLDPDGYLFVADRRADLIISGGVNIYPAEVEAALSEHPGIEDVAVIGLPDEDRGKRVHAVIQCKPEVTLTVEELDDHCRQRLVRYKIPRSYEFIPRLPRDESGKLRRSALVSERTGTLPEQLR
jgi:bile acid-coenzyme A ligase